MKRFLSITLILTLFLPVCLALAADVPTDLMENRMAAQYRKNGFYAELTADIRGNAHEWIDPTTWALLGRLLPGVTLKYESTVRTSNRETVISLDKEDATLTDITIIEDGQMTLVKSGLLPAANGDMWYGASASYKLVDLLGALTNRESDSQWPSLYGVMLSVLTADDDWKVKAGISMNHYLTGLGIWIQRYTKVAVVTGDDDKAYTEMTCQIPADAVKTQLIALVTSFLADEDLLTQLRETLSAEEAAAYLNPALVNDFAQMIASISMSGDIIIVRRFNMQGLEVMESIELPFADTQALSHARIAMDMTGDTPTYHIEASLRAPHGAENANVTIQLDAAVNEEGAYVGDLILTLPATGAGEYVIVENPTIDLNYSFYFFLDTPEQTYDVAADRASHVMDAMLVLTPGEGNDGHRHSFTFHADFSSRASDATPTRLNATLSAMDLTADSGITLNLSARTAVAWTPAHFVYAVPTANVLRIDQLTKSARDALVKQCTTYNTALIDLIAKLAPSNVVLTDDDLTP